MIEGTIAGLKRCLPIWNIRAKLGQIGQKSIYFRGEQNVNKIFAMKKNHVLPGQGCGSF